MSENQDKKNKKKFDIELKEEIADGIFSNLVVITHSNSEFVLDFVRVMPGMKGGKVKSRIIITPQHAKRLRNALSENIEKYEKMFGSVSENEPTKDMPINVFGPSGQA